MVSGNVLVRGCLHCKYSEEFYLPPLFKVVLYLDQFFLSHAFRAELPEFVEAAKLIADLTHRQLLVCPYSSTHETETHQWRHPQQQRLWEFIKKTSRGHEFHREYEITRKQIVHGFERFLAGDTMPFRIETNDALPRELYDWESYFRVDVPRPPQDVELTRRFKLKAVEELVGIFPDWRKDTTTFEEDRRLESRVAAREYLKAYIKKAERVASGDLMAMLDSPIDTRIVESLLHWDREDMNAPTRWKRVVEYLNSDYFQEVPCEWVSSGLFAVLKDRVKQGYCQNPNKAKERLSGFFYDVQFVSAYAPYSDAMFLDNSMLDFASDKNLGLTQRLGTRLFARSNWDEFMTYLETVKIEKQRRSRLALLWCTPRPSRYGPNPRMNTDAQTAALRLVFACRLCADR
jgi:hypothetical protein